MAHVISFSNHGITQKQIVVAHSNKRQNKRDMIAYQAQNISYAHKVTVSIPIPIKGSNFQVRQYNTCFGGIFGYIKLYCEKKMACPIDKIVLGQ